MLCGFEYYGVVEELLVYWWIFVYQYYVEFVQVVLVCFVEVELVGWIIFYGQWCQVCLWCFVMQGQVVLFYVEQLMVVVLCFEQYGECVVFGDFDGIDGVYQYGD